MSQGMFRLPGQLQYAVGHSFTDLLHPERLETNVPSRDAKVGLGGCG